MKKDYNLEFIKNKVRQTGTALCSLYVPGLQNTSYIVHTTNVDETGILSFELIDRFPENLRHEFECFGIRLFYYKKGLGYFMNIEALASATTSQKNDPEQDVLSVKAQIQSVEYNEGNYSFHQQKPGLLHAFRKKISQMAASLFW
jgi:hypothetical protein